MASQGQGPSQQVTLQASGLRTSPNPLTVSQGGLSLASNVNIVRDNIIEQRRGFKLYGTQANFAIEQLLQYKNRILRHNGTELDFDTQILNADGESIFDAFNGSYSEVDPGLRIKYIDVNGNLYFTTSDGIKKISAISATGINGFSTAPGYITNAGGVKAINGSARIDLMLGQTNGFLPQDSTVAYRIVWGITDANDNLILGTPSQRIVLYNPLMGFLIPDYMALLGALDNITQNTTTAFIGDDDYVATLALSANNSPSDLQSNLIELADKLDVDILYADAMGAAPLQIASVSVSTTGIASVFLSSGDATQYIVPGSNIEIGGFTTTFPNNLTEFNSNFVVSSVNSTSISFLFPGAFTSFSTVNADSTAYINSFEYMNAIENISFNGSIVDLTSYTQSNPVNDNDLSILQAAISAIETQLRLEPITVISQSNQNAYISVLDVTTSTNVLLTINIPQDINSNYFLQIYRSHTEQATGTTVLSDLVPDDEMQLVYEAFPTPAQLSAHQMIVLDLLLDEFKGADLYTNPESGEGILQANDIPPVAHDINLFNNVTYYANTRTKQILPLNLLGVTNFKAGNILSISPSATVMNVVADAITGLSNNDIVYINGTGISGIDEQLFPATVLSTSSFSIPFTSTSSSSVGYWTDSMIAIVNASVSQNYYFIKQTSETTNITTVADVSGSLNGKYFTLNSGQDFDQYYVWYSASGSAVSDPAVPGRTGIRINIGANDSAGVVAASTYTSLLQFPQDFLVSQSGSVVTVTNLLAGITTDATVGTSGFTISITQQGRGEDAALNEVAISNSLSPAIAVDETASSFVNVVNSNTTENVYIYYLSGVSTIPGQMQFEARELNVPQFYVVANNASVGASFNPAITPDPNINITESVGSPTTITAAGHGLNSGDQVVLAFTNSVPSSEGVFTATVLSTSTFNVPVSVSKVGTTGVMISVNNAISSTDQEKINRVYYSKISQPEAVPSVNFIDIGSAERKIVRIFPLRDSLFVFKEDGVYRISGTTLPPQVDLFDSSCFLIAADSLGVANNIIYGWTTQGIQTITEAGIDIVSRDIRNSIIPLASTNYPNFGTITWGIGNNSDNAYIVFTNSSPSDETATIAYRFCNLTNTWSTWEKNNTCGVILFSDDKLYMGAGDVNFVEQERKSFDRTDYADRQYAATLASNGYFDNGNSLSISNVSNVEIGDVLLQSQYVTAYNFNALLKKLDNDPSVGVVNIVSISTSLIPTITTVNFQFLPGSVDTVTNTILISDNNFIPNQKIKFNSTGTLPSGLNSTDTFFILNPTTSGFQVSATSNGSALSLGTQGTGIHTVFPNDNLSIGDVVILAKTNSDPVIDGSYSVTSVINDYTFQITLTSPVTTAGNSGQAKLDYFDTLQMFGGDDPKADLLALAAKLDTDPGTELNNYSSQIQTEDGTITSIMATNPATIVTSSPHGLETGRVVALAGTNSVPTIDNIFLVTVINASTFTVPIQVTSFGTTGTYATQNSNFQDIQGCFNIIINNLNSDAGVTFKNYSTITETTDFEALVLAVSTNGNKLTLTPALPWLIGDLTTFSAIDYSILYLPETMNDPVNFKQVREASIMFLNKAFTSAKAYFASDLLPELKEVDFNGDGNGIFGSNLFGNGYFGGGSHAAPFRTYIPQQVQRCRYIIVGFEHRIAREQFGITGVSLTGRAGLSSRAYRG